MTRIKNLIINSIVTLTAFLFCLLLIEIGLRIFAPQSPSALKSDPCLQVVHTPNAKYIYQKKTIKVPIQYNSRGLRDREHAYDKSPGVFRIAMVGDSFLEAREVFLEETLTWRLEGMLKEMTAPEGKYETINFGVIGYGTAHYLETIKRFVFLYNPDMVIVGFCLNDVGNNILFPNVKLENDSLYFLTPKTPSLRKKISTSITCFLSSHSHLWNLARPVLIKILLPKKTRSIADIHVPEITGKKLPPEEVPFYFQNYTLHYNDEIESAWALTLALLKGIDMECTKMCVPFVLFMIPSPEQLEEEKLVQALNRYDVNRGDFDTQKPTRLLATFCSEENIPFLDLQPAFRRAINAGNKCSFTIDYHWNSYGNNLASVELSRFLLDRGLLPEQAEE